ncbi:MAG: GAF domain-containing protein, partial [Deltaproteobacteria bacterium]|nr:GAF domain-containing protein [Deltaproteobacteria bacterium]
CATFRTNVSLGPQRGQALLFIIGLLAIAGLLALLLALLRVEPIAGIDPVALLLVITYPPLFGGLIYFYLQHKKTSAALKEEYFYKWFLQSFAKVCHSESDLQTIREELINTVLRLIRPVLVMLYELNVETNRLQMTQKGGIKNLPETAARDYMLSEGIPGWVMQNQNIVILPDISRETYLQTDAWTRALGLRSYAAIPVIARGNSIGIIAMYALEPDFFQDTNLLVAQLAAQLYGLSLAAQGVNSQQ